MHTNLIKAPIQRGRRRYTEEFKKQAIEACMQPGISMASIALANGLNANLLRRWVTEHHERTPKASTLAVRCEPAMSEPTAPGLVPIMVAMPEMTPSSEIKIEIHRSQTLISITWPIAQSASCADWLRDLLQ